jgi:hypothetical protein
MTFSDFIHHLASSRLAIFGYTLMFGIFLETLRLAWLAQLELRQAQKLHTWLLAKPHNRSEALPDANARIEHFLSETLLPIRHKLQSFETIAAYCGLAMTFATYALALPQAATLMRSDPNALFSTFGIGAGTSFIALIAAIIASTFARRLESLEERIAALLYHMPPNDPAAMAEMGRPIAPSAQSMWRGKP